MDALDIFRKLSAGAKFTHHRSKIKKEVQEYVNKSKEIYNPIDYTNDKNHGNKFKNHKNEKQVNQQSDNSNEGKEESEHAPIELLRNVPVKDVNRHSERIKKKKLKSNISQEDLEKKKQKQQLGELRNRHHISVSGKRVPSIFCEFEDLVDRYKLSTVLIKNLAKSGFAKPTPIQMQAIPSMLEGRHVMACAPTGSGKTIAFVLPVLHYLKKPTNKGYRAVIVCPTRELARQTYRESIRMSEGTGLRVNLISKISQNKNNLNSKTVQKFDLLITTPNRLVYLLNQDPPRVDLKNVEWLIIDECDKLFETGMRGFRDQLAIIYNACESVIVKRAMFSATQTPLLTKWCKKNLKNLVIINVGIRNSAVSSVNQELLFVGNEQGKLLAIRDLIRKGITPPVLVFVQTKERAQELFSELVYDGINVDVIHSDRSQKQRDNVIRSFREGKIWVLICTELMGRGIDFKGVSLVVNYDFPPTSISYIHRIGRTGRAGRPGRAITYFTHDDETNLRNIAYILKESGCSVPNFMLKLKKSNKRDLKKLASRAPRRACISTTPIYQKIYERKQKIKSKRIENNGEGTLSMGRTENLEMEVDV